MNHTNNTGGLDRFRLAGALLVVAIHTSPLTFISAEADFFLTRILARVAVPFFLMVTGQFVLPRILAPGPKAGRRLLRYRPARVCSIWSASCCTCLWESMRGITRK